MLSNEEGAARSLRTHELKKEKKKVTLHTIFSKVKVMLVREQRRREIE